MHTKKNVVSPKFITRFSPDYHQVYMLSSGSAAGIAVLGVDLRGDTASTDYSAVHLEQWRVSLHNRSFNMNSSTPC